MMSECFEKSPNAMNHNDKSSLVDPLMISESVRSVPNAKESQRQLRTFWSTDDLSKCRKCKKTQWIAMTNRRLLIQWWCLKESEMLQTVWFVMTNQYWLIHWWYRKASEMLQTLWISMKINTVWVTDNVWKQRKCSKRYESNNKSTLVDLLMMSESLGKAPHVVDRD